MGVPIMGRIGRLARGCAIAAAATALVIPTAAAAPSASSRHDLPAFRLSDIREGQLIDVADMGHDSPKAQELASHGLSVMRAESGEAAIVDSSLAEAGAAIATGVDFVDVSWSPYSEDAQYVITRNEVEIAVTDAGKEGFRDAGVTPGTTYRYEVVPIHGSDGSDNEVPMWSMEVTVPVVDESENAVAEMLEQATTQALAASAATKTNVTWVSFIPQKRIDVPGGGVCDYGSGYQFGGDGRSYDPYSPLYRTQVTAVITWSSRTVNSDVRIGATHVYNKSTGKLVATKTASGKNSYAKKLSVGTTSEQDIRLVTHASNPFCKIGAIDGAFSMTITRSGNYAIFSGNHRQMPNHHVYIVNGGKITNVYKRDYASAACLIGSITCPLANFTGSGRY